MKKQLLRLGLSANLLFISFCYSPRANALTKTMSELAGSNYGEAICQSVWTGNPKTKDEAYDKAINYIEYQSTIEDINMAQSIHHKYGKDHPIANAFIEGIAETVVDNCLAEYEALP